MGTQGVGPPGLLSMPGFSLKDSAPVNFRKSHLFDIQGGIPVVKDGPSVAVKLPQPSATQNSSVEVDEAAVAASDTTPGTPATMLPSWLAYDRKVLRFNCHFKESVQESRLENFRIRNFVIYYYLEDDTMHVSEPKVENSGLLQGEHKGTVFLKRHRIPKSDGSMFTHADLNVGVEVQLYGRAYLITDADPFTREFLEASGVTVGDGISVPQDQYATAREEMKSLVVQNQKYFHPRPADDEMIRALPAT